MTASDAVRRATLAARAADDKKALDIVVLDVGEIISITEMFASGALNAIGDLLTLVVIVVAMLGINWQMSLFAFAALPPVALGVNWTRRRIRDAYRDESRKSGS